MQFMQLHCGAYIYLQCNSDIMLCNSVVCVFVFVFVYAYVFLAHGGPTVEVCARHQGSAAQHCGERVGQSVLLQIAEFLVDVPRTHCEVTRYYGMQLCCLTQSCICCSIS